MLLEFESRSDCVRLGHCFISNIAQLCPTVCNPMDGSLPGSFVHKIFQARVQEWVAISFSKGLVKDQVSGDSSVQLLSRVQLFVTPWTAARRASLSITNSQNLLKLMPIESVMPFNHLILCHPLLPPSIFPSNSKSSKIESHPFQGLYFLITTPNHTELQNRPVELHITL